MKASSAHRLLPFKTFGEAAAFDLEVEVSCRCGRRVVIDGKAPAFRDRRIMGTRFRCTTILPHGVACAGSPSIYIGKRGRWGMTMAEHSHALRGREAAAPIDAKPGTFGSIVKRCEVAFLYDRGCVPSYTIDMIEFDEPPWDRFLDKPWAGSFAQDAARRSTCTLATDPVRRGRSVSTRSPKPPMALARLQLLAAGLGEAHRMQATGNDEPIPLNRVGDAGRIGRDRAQVAEGLPSLRLAAGRLVQLVDDVPRGHVGPVTGFEDLGLGLGRGDVEGSR
jgi:hypothetical protein